MHQEVHPPRVVDAAAPDGWFIAALVILVGGAPCLLFPSLVPAGVGAWAVPSCMAAAMALPLCLLRHVRPLVLALALFELAVAVAWWHMPTHDAEAVSHTAGLAFGVLLMSTLAVWCRTPARLRTAATLVALVACVVLPVGVLGTGDNDKVLVSALSGRLALGLPGLEWGVVNPNAVGGTAVLVAPLALALLSLWKTLTRPQRFVALAASVTAVATLAISGSRTAWFAAALVLVVWTTASATRGPRGAAARRLVLAGSGAAVAVAALWAWLDAGRLQRLVASLGPSLRIRLAMWKAAVDTLGASPWFGGGINQFRRLTLSIMEGARPVFFHPSHAHNIFLQVALDIGLPGLAAYLLLTVLVLRIAVDAARGPDAAVARLAAGAAASLVAVHLFGLADAIALGAKVGAFQWAACGLILAASRVQAQRLY